MFDIDERIIVLTGAGGQLGRQYLSALLDSGAKVVAIDINVNVNIKLDKIKKAEHEERLMFLQCDITDKDQVKKACECIVSKWGIPFGLINNAALDSPPDSSVSETGPFENYPLENFEKVMNVNVTGTLVCCQVFGEQMAKVGSGSIVNIGSIYGALSPDQDLYQYRRDRGDEFYKPISYSVSKSAILNLTRYLAHYWGNKGVRVNTLTLAGVSNNQDSEFLKKYNRKVSLGRMAREDEYNGSIVFLMSDASSYITGSNMVVDGGFTIT